MIDSLKVYCIIINMKKILLSLTIIFLLGFSGPVDAYVSVSGYYKTNGTYVAPYVRSNPNGLKYDNYGWKPSQGLYNSSFGTRGSSWDTPTWVTDPYYYEGKSIYQSNNTYYTPPKAPKIPTYTPPKTPSIDTARLSFTESSKNKNTIKVPSNATLSTFGSDWYCDSGYKTKYDDNFNKVGCTKIRVPEHATLSTFGSDWYCDSGYETKYDSNFERIGCTK